MAIKVNGTTVIDDSRNLSNVGGLKTVNGNSLVGSGDIQAGASTTYGAVGTYVWGHRTSRITEGSSYAGSGIRPAGIGNYPFSGADSQETGQATRGSSTVSGTWRAMGRQQSATWAEGATLFVRIS